MILGLESGATSDVEVYTRGTINAVKYFQNKAITYELYDSQKYITITVYLGKGLNGADFNDISDLAKGDVVVVKGKLCKYGSNNTPEITNSQIASFESTATRYSVSFGEVPAGCSISASATSAAAGAKITLSKTLASGYEFDGWTVTNTSDNTPVTVTNDQFTMPAGNVEVNASFNYTGTTTITKTMNQIVSANNYTVSAGSNVTLYPSFSLDDVITVSTTGDANCGSFWGTTTYDWRLYQNKKGDITISASEGHTISKLTITYNVSNTGTLKSGTAVISSGVEQAINASSVTYTVGNTGSATNGQVKVTQISVTYN